MVSLFKSETIFFYKLINILLKIITNADVINTMHLFVKVKHLFIAAQNSLFFQITLCQREHLI